MNIIDSKSLLTSAQHSLLQTCAKKSFNLGGFCSIDDILTKLNVDVIIESGIIKRTIPSFFNDALNYWMKMAERIKREIEKAKTDSEKNKLKEELEKVSEIIQPILPREMSCWTEMSLRGLYDPIENVIKLYPEEMHNEYAGARMNELLVSTLAHETMHAYFNRPGHKFDYIPTVEEPLAEFGMLLYLNDTGSGYYNWAYNDVKGKHTCYKYGVNLMDQYQKESSPYPTRQFLEKYMFKLFAYSILVVKLGRVVLFTPKKSGLGVDEIPIGKVPSLFPIMPLPLPSSVKVSSKRTIVVQEKVLRQFVLKVFIYLEGMGLLGKLSSYIVPKPNPKSTGNNALMLEGFFNFTCILWSLFDFSYEPRLWFTSYSFNISGDDFLLSTQWRDGGTPPQGLQFNEFVRMMKYVYPQFDIQKISGEYIMIY